MDSVGEGEGGKIWENGTETCKISCMKCIFLNHFDHQQSRERKIEIQQGNLLGYIMLLLLLR